VPSPAAMIGERIEDRTPAHAPVISL
jgi:hypothetical protein